jgi:ABC-type transport system involved in cytochrome bd biosynthesis fused ATPase/permease subunit
VRLADGSLGLRAGLLALILAPEAFLPLRNASAQFHATADGLAAAEKAFTVLEAPAPAAGVARCGASGVAIRVHGVSVRHEGRAAAAPDRVSLTVSPGRLTALAGPSGCGKSTLLAVLLGFARPDEGRVVITARGSQANPGETGLRETNLRDMDLDGWRSMTGWVPQEPTLFPGTIADNIRLGWPDAPDEAVRAAARAAALTGDEPGRCHLGDVPLDKVLADRGAGLSAGQRRRVAIARALLPRPDGTPRPVLLLDEPTAGLDAKAEARVIAMLRAEAARGRAILVVSHHPAVLAAADEVIVLPVTALPPTAPPPTAPPAACAVIVPAISAEVPA